MKSSRIKKAIISLFIVLLCQMKANLCLAQTDSAFYWRNALLKETSEKKAVKLGEKIQAFFTKRTDSSYFSDAEIILTAAANSRFNKIVFYNIFFGLFGFTENKNDETEFTKFALSLENNPEFTNPDIKCQLYYLYTLKFFKLKEYFYAEKYCNLFLKNGKHAFPDFAQENYYLNAMTILALIDEAKDNYAEAYQKLTTTLDSCLAKKNNVWIGITKGNLAYVLYKQGKLNEAIPYLNEDVKTSLEYHELGSALNAFLTLSDIYRKLNQEDRANLCTDSAHLLLQKLIDFKKDNEQTFKKQAFEIHLALAERYLKKQDYLNASKFYSKALEQKDLQSDEEKQVEIKKVIQAFEIDKKIEQINELKQEILKKNQLQVFYILMILFVICLLIGYIIFYRKLKTVNHSLVEKTEIIKQQNIVLEKINTDKDRLFSIISHDLRAPANNLHSIFKAVEDKKLPASILEDQLPNIVKNSTNLINALESLLTWSVSQLKGIVSNKEFVNIQDSVLNNMLFFEDQANKKSITLINNCESKMVLFDRNHLDIILRNFTSNAIKFSKPFSTIQFDLTEYADYVEVSVTDHGSGLTAEQINHIMTNTAIKSMVGTSGEKGIGLGLLLTKEFIEINGGVLKVKSKLHEGTTMSFSIPKAV